MAPHSIESIAVESTSVEVNSQPHIIIIGAGVTGLLLAQGLKKAGIAFSVFESEGTAQRARSREWGMSIHWARPLLDDILPAALLARIREAQVDPSFDTADAAGYAVPFYNGKTGEHIVAMPMPGAVRVSRRKMRALCSEGIDVKFGETLVDIQESEGGATAIFESGTTAHGTVIVGTDGPQSAVRTLLLGEDGRAEKISVVLYNINVCYRDAAKALHVRRLHKMNTVALHPEQSLSLWTSIQDVPDPAAPETWQFQIMPTWLDDGKAHVGGAAGLAELKHIAQSLAEPWRSSILWVPEDTDVPPPSSVAYWVTRAWDNRAGTVTLAGDAAHPLPPHRGQGLNHCIADVRNLLQALQSVSAAATSRSDAISAYDAELVRRGADEVETSRRNALLVHDFEGFMDSPVLKLGYARAKAAAAAAGEGAE